MYKKILVTITILMSIILILSGCNKIKENKTTNKASTVIVDNSESITKKIEEADMNKELEKKEIIEVEKDEYTKAKEEAIKKEKIEKDKADYKRRVIAKSPNFTIQRIDNTTGELTYNYSALTDNILKCKIIFENEMDKDSVTQTIRDNIYLNIYEINDKEDKELPNFKFEWEDDKSLYVTLSGLVIGNKYNINLNGAKDIKGNKILVENTTSSNIGSYYDINNMIYDFVIVDNQKIVEYDLNTGEIKDVLDIGNESYSIGKISNDNSWIIFGIYDEWVYNPTVLNINTGNKDWIGDKITGFCYEESFLGKDMAILPYQHELGYYSYATNEVNVIDFNNKNYHFTSAKENPYNNTIGVIGYENEVYDKSGETFFVFDDKFNEVKKTKLNIHFIRGMYSSYYDFWWLNENHICVTGRDEQKQINTYIININNGDIIKEIKNSKISSISPNGSKIALFDISDEENISVNLYDKDFNLLSSNNEIKFNIYNSRIIWAENKPFYIGEDEKYKTVVWNLESNEKLNIDLESKHFVILDIMEDNKLLILVNASELRHMYQ